MRTPAATIPAYLDRFTVGPVPAYRPDLGPCWLWTGGHSGDGYGAVVDPDGRVVVAHRAMYEALIGPIPPGLHTDHLCRVRGCVRPTHVEPVTCRENILRSPVALAALNARKTHCHLGHPLTDDNLVQRHGRNRDCLTCHRERQQRRRAALATKG